jgi:hypothetical protein
MRVQRVRRRMGVGNFMGGTVTVKGGEVKARRDGGREGRRQGGAEGRRHEGELA